MRKAEIEKRMKEVKENDRYIASQLRKGRTESKKERRRVQKKKKYKE